MKETHKKICGFLGLAVVASMTVVATQIPEAHAATSTVTDIISVRVVNPVPDITIDGIINNEVDFAPEKTFSVDYDNVTSVTVTLEYTDTEGNVHNYVIDTISGIDYGSGTKSYTINALDYIPASSTGDGYGTYSITVRGEGHEGAFDSETSTFKYLPLYGEVTEENEKYYLDIESNNGDPSVTPETESVKAVVKIYNKDTGEEVPFSPIEVGLPTERIELPFEEYGLPEGTYVVEISAVNANGDTLGAPYKIEVVYSQGGTTPDSDGGGTGTIVPVPDTGGMFQGGISKTDYIITGLIVLAIVGIAGAVYIMKHDKKKATVKIRRRK